MLTVAQVFVGRYLVTGAEQHSLYLDVVGIDGSDVRCAARNAASLDGLLTVHVCGCGEADAPELTCDVA